MILGRTSEKQIEKNPSEKNDRLLFAISQSFSVIKTGQIECQFFCYL